MNIKNVGVIGSGIMGSGIAQVVLQAGFQVTLYDISENSLNKGLEYIEKNFKKDVIKGRKNQDFVNFMMDNIVATVDMEKLKNMDVIFEVAIENMDIKEDIIIKMSSLCKKDTIFITNTSSLSITKMGAISGRADKFIGMHFFNPVPVMKLVEVIKGFNTSEETFNIAMDLAVKLGKDPIAVNDSPLFAVNRILVPMLNEAAFVLAEGIASKEDIDKGMVLGTNQPIGPLALSDMIGLDTLLSVMETLYDETKDSKYRPAPLLVKMVRAGYMGRKNGKGYYDYSN